MCLLANDVSTSLVNYDSSIPIHTYGGVGDRLKCQMCVRCVCARPPLVCKKQPDSWLRARGRTSVHANEGHRIELWSLSFCLCLYVNKFLDVRYCDLCVCSHQCHVLAYTSKLATPHTNAVKAENARGERARMSSMLVDTRRV